MKRLTLILCILSFFSVARSATASELPVCQVKDPPFAPNRFPEPQFDLGKESTIVVGQLNNRCQRLGQTEVAGFDHLVEAWVAAQVWQLGAWGCLQARPWPSASWRNVECMAARVYNKTALTLYVDCTAKRSKDYWQWRVQGHVWVFYVPTGDVTPYRSKTVTSPFVPLRLAPPKDCAVGK